MDLVVYYIHALDVIIIPGSHASPHGDIFIEKNVRDAPSEIYKEGVDIVNGELFCGDGWHTVSMSMDRH